MVNDLYRNKNIEQIRKRLHAVACNVPKEDPFTRTGSQVWQDWSDLCRGYESELRAAGEVF